MHQNVTIYTLCEKACLFQTAEQVLTLEAEILYYNSHYSYRTFMIKLSFYQ